MTKEEIKDFCDMKAQLEPENEDIFKAIVKILEQEPTTKNDLGVDCISRQAVLDLINADWKYENLEIEINNLPSVTPQEKKGHWIPVFQGDEIIDYRCSCCEFGNTFGKGTVGMNYCPRCGSRNEVEE